jgi:hypothetical protein
MRLRLTQGNENISHRANWSSNSLGTGQGRTIKLSEYLNHKMELVKIDVPVATQTGNPWLDQFGWFKDDPTFDNLEAEIAAYRQKLIKRWSPQSSEFIFIRQRPS